MKWLKVGGVVFGAVAITALGIDAADTLQGSRSTLLGQLVSSEVAGGCPEGMIALETALTFSCVDMYEASASEDCRHAEPQTLLHTTENLEDAACAAYSQKSVKPWRFITREQAELACSRAGKRLPSNEEWQIFAVGTPDTSIECNIDRSSVSMTGSNQNCVSSFSVFDTVGNVWEWTNDDVFDGVYNGRRLPEEGYVAQVDKGGVATVATTTPSELFGNDYFWSETKGVYAMMRGGYFGSEEDAGVYATHAATLPTMNGTAIGFRCVL